MNLIIIDGVMDLQIDHSDDSRIQQKLCHRQRFWPTVEKMMHPLPPDLKLIDTHITSIWVQIRRWDLGINIVECQMKEGSCMSSSKSCQRLELSKSNLISLTLIQKNWYHVYTSEFSTEAMGFVMRCAVKSLDEERKTEHNIRIRRLVSSKECNGVNSVRE